MAFKSAHGRMQVGSFSAPDNETGEIRNFKSCIFTDPNDASKKTFVSFSSKMGELSPSEIVARKDELQVIELESGTFKLCPMGENAWEDVLL